jgi:hypothetical protein
MRDFMKDMGLQSGLPDHRFLDFFSYFSYFSYSRTSLILNRSPDTV